MSMIKTRFAPSPTGFIHIGSLRTALYSYIFARQNGGKFILRIEDTDQSRKVEGGIAAIMDTLGKFIEWDEGPYIQSKRLEEGVYDKYVKKLLDSGSAYYCFCSAERLEEMRKEQQVNKQAPMYDRKCVDAYTHEEIQKKIKSGEKYVIRLKVPRGRDIEFNDIVRGKIKINTDNIDDQVLVKSDGFPTYHLAVVVDDSEMGITHIIRGEEWISSTPKHILIYEALGLEAARYAHLPLLLNPDKSKLSKRQGDVAVEDYLAKGYLIEAIINFVALLGWNPGKGSAQEFFTLEELIEKFELENVHKAGAVCDLKRLDWFNNHYIKKLSIDEFYEKAFPFMKEKEFYASAVDEKKSEDFIKKVLTVEQERLSKLMDIGEENKFFFKEIRLDAGLLNWKEMSKEDLISSLQKSKEILTKISEKDWTRENLQNLLLEEATKFNKDRGQLLWPLRASLTGERKSLPPFDAAWVLGKEEAVKRIENALVLIAE